MKEIFVSLQKLFKMQIDIDKTQRENAILNNVSNYKIHKYCKTNNINLPDGRGRNPNVISNPFNINSREGQYWLGYFVGDGFYIYESMAIKSIDLQIIEDFHLHCQNKNKINTRSYTTNTGEVKLIYTSYFGNKEVYKYLLNLGICQRKTFNMKINFNITWDFIRGLFDADGSFSKNSFKITTSNTDLLKKLDSFFKENNFGTTTYTKDNSFDLCITWGAKLGRNKQEMLEEKIRLYNLLYKDSSFCLLRKKAQIAAFIGNNN